MRRLFVVHMVFLGGKIAPKLVLIGNQGGNLSYDSKKPEYSPPEKVDDVNKTTHFQRAERKN